MQTVIFAMFVIGILLILRDMAKIIFWERRRKKEALQFDAGPQREQMEKYARSFQRLASTFYDMPVRREGFSPQETERMLRETEETVCSRCAGREECWRRKRCRSRELGENLIRAMEMAEPEVITAAQGDWFDMCRNGARFLEELKHIFVRERQNLIWNNRLIEGRLAVAEQLGEISRIMQQVANNIYNITLAPAEQEEQVRKVLARKQVLVKQMWMLEKAQGKLRFFLTLRARSGQCVTIREVTRILSGVFECPIAAARESRVVLSRDYTTILFQEDVHFQVLTGVARITREAESVSGDNYLCSDEGDSYLLCLSDGCGSGMEACRESENVVELLELFLSSGFSRETAARMVNSALVLQRSEGMFSTVDICSLDLYTGICEFLKAGAASTFIRRDHWVETVSSTSLAAGLVQELDFESTTKKLYDGDYLIMVTDGVLDALPEENAEEVMKEFIMENTSTSPREMGRTLLERVMGCSGYRAADDMTVLVAGIWKKQ